MESIEKNIFAREPSDKNIFAHKPSAIKEELNVLLKKLPCLGYEALFEEIKNTAEKVFAREIAEDAFNATRAGIGMSSA